MTDEIIRKLTEQINVGIATEIQVVYVLAGIRKIIERDKVDDRYPELKFHCDWALHSSMDRAAARSILIQFDAAHPLLQGQIRVHDLPWELRNEIDRISQMKSFEVELAQFLANYGLPPITAKRSDGWIYFLHLYCKVIEDIPLVVKQDTSTQNISQVTVRLELARETIKHSEGEEMMFKVSWVIQDKNGGSGELFILNSFSLPSQEVPLVETAAPPVPRSRKNLFFYGGLVLFLVLLYAAATFLQTTNPDGRSFEAATDIAVPVLIGAFVARKFGMGWGLLVGVSLAVAAQFGSRK